LFGQIVEVSHLNIGNLQINEVVEIMQYRNLAITSLITFCVAACQNNFNDSKVCGISARQFAQLVSNSVWILTEDSSEYMYREGEFIALTYDYSREDEATIKTISFGIGPGLAGITTGGIFSESYFEVVGDNIKFEATQMEMGVEKFEFQCSIQEGVPSESERLILIEQSHLDVSSNVLPPKTGSPLIYERVLLD
jgi:hypothetical protein